ncbi:hypothetical protein GSF04_17745 [Pseudoalteromonas sp. A22]|uniref:hypothetical protein n=1 Tax=Pseudoalteromonas TaxID=53246 RepID=UPI001BA69537|nr:MULTISPECIES: hypothetical protein [Pseudoalteromonas]MCG9770568.1 hypothetical protein [Pseudoalteromonas piscicida]QUI64223.1 hypothetical protein GSF04_17745 [Pseudoalteromonas sp. A22]
MYKLSYILVLLIALILTTTFICFNYLQSIEIAKAEQRAYFTKLIGESSKNDQLLQAAISGLHVDKCGFLTDSKSWWFKYTLAEEMNHTIVEYEKLVEQYRPRLDLSTLTCS